MQMTLASPLLALEAGQIVTLDDACGARIEPRQGTVWITEEGNTRDFVVQPGEAFVVTRGGRTLVQAMRRAWVSVQETGLRCVPTRPA